MIKELEAENSENQDSMKKETLAITQEIDLLKSHSSGINNKLDEMDTGNQQLLEKLFSIERDLDGKLKASTIVLMNFRQSLTQWIMRIRIILNKLSTSKGQYSFNLNNSKELM